MTVTRDSGVTFGFGGGGILPGAQTGYTTVATGSELISQGPIAVDTPHQITFGTPINITNDIDIAANGEFTCNVAGEYLFFMTLNYARTSPTGTSQMHVRVLFDGVQLGGSGDNYFTNQNDKLSKSTSFVLGMTVGQVLTIELLRDSTGANDGGLEATNPTPVDWNTTPSAGMVIYKPTA
tara:strand:- start:2095 stop:2634 length:540 start_codon:yes stop_codon:yes gene_type:complete